MVMNKASVIAAAVLSVGLLIPSVGQAAPENIVWDNTSGDFKYTTASNWDTDNAPISTDFAAINNGQTVTIGTGDTGAADVLALGGGDDGSGFTGHINQSGGTLNISNALQIGRATGTTGSYTLSGGTLNATGAVTVGRKGAGTFTQTGGQVNTPNVFIGDWSSGSGTYSISNGLLVADNIGHPSSEGPATLNISGTGTVAVGVIHGDGLQTININFTGGTLGALVVNQNLTNAGGRLEAAGSLVDATGISDINGDYTQSSGTLAVDIEGLSQGSSYDLFDISGLASLAGSIDVSLLSFTPTPGDFFDVFTAIDITDTSVLIGDAGFTKSIVSGGNGEILRLTYVPEPASLSVVGLLGLCALARRR